MSESDSFLVNKICSFMFTCQLVLPFNNQQNMLSFTFTSLGFFCLNLILFLGTKYAPSCSLVNLFFPSTMTTKYALLQFYKSRLLMYESDSFLVNKYAPSWSLVSLFSPSTMTTIYALLHFYKSWLLMSESGSFLVKKICSFMFTCQVVLPFKNQQNMLSFTFTSLGFLCLNLILFLWTKYAPSCSLVSLFSPSHSRYHYICSPLKLLLQNYAKQKQLWG